MITQVPPFPVGGMDGFKCLVALQNHCPLYSGMGVHFTPEFAAFFQITFSLSRESEKVKISCCYDFRDFKAVGMASFEPDGGTF